jgi:hypothetical protein
MGLKPVTLPDSMLRAMSKPDRKALGLITSEEALCAQQIRQERDMHNLFTNWLRLTGVPFIHARMDKKSTIRKGWPDFTLLWQGRALCLEFKLPGQPLDPDQVEVHAALALNGTPVQTVYSVAEAIVAARTLSKSAENSAETAGKQAQCS